MLLLKTKSVKRKLGLLTSLFIFAVLSACAAATPVAAPIVPPTASVTPTVPPSLSSDQEALLRELTKAIRDHNAEEVNRLLELGVAVNDIQSFRQLTPLALASYEGDTEIIALLLEHGAEIVIYNKNQYGTTALIEAAQNGKTEAVKYLPIWRPCFELGYLLRACGCGQGFDRVRCRIDRCRVGRWYRIEHRHCPGTRRY